MNYTKILKKNPYLFPFINVSLAEDLTELPSSKVMKLKFSKLYQLEYVGEVAERWMEREGLVKNTADFLGLTIGLSNAFTNDFLYNQKDNFIQKASEYLAKEFDITAALLVLYFAYEQSIDIDKSDTLKSIFNAILTYEKKMEEPIETLIFGKNFHYTAWV